VGIVPKIRFRLALHGRRGGLVVMVVDVRVGYERDDLSGLRDIRVSRLIIRFMASRLLPFKSGRRAKIASSSALAVAERSSVDRSRAIIAFYLM
jgi:hypothetical protein